MKYKKSKRIERKTVKTKKAVYKYTYEIIDGKRTQISKQRISSIIPKKEVIITEKGYFKRKKLKAMLDNFTEISEVKKAEVLNVAEKLAKSNRGSSQYDEGEDYTFNSLISRAEKDKRVKMILNTRLSFEEGLSQLGVSEEQYLDSENWKRKAFRTSSDDERVGEVFFNPLTEKYYLFRFNSGYETGISIWEEVKII